MGIEIWTDNPRRIIVSSIPVPSVLSFLLMCFLWHPFTGVACLWSVKGVGASVLGGVKSKNKPFCFTSCGFAYACLLLPVGVFFSHLPLVASCCGSLFFGLKC